MGVERGMVIYGQDCLDEFSISAPTSVGEFKDGWFRRYDVTPEDFGISRATKDDILGGTPEENAKITVDILTGAQGPKTDIVLLNAGAAIYVGGKADSIAEGIHIARECITSGEAKKILDKFVKMSNA